MSVQSRATLKGYFNAGDTPTEVQFTNLIDSIPNFTDDFATKYVKVAVSSADILQLNSIPKTLVIAPGSGKILIPVFAIAKLTFGSGAYDSTNNDPQIKLSGATDYLMGFPNLLSQGSNFRIFRSMRELNIDQPENAALILTEDVDPTSGDGTLAIYLWYKIVTL